jgi:formylglycine-generating enzyme required for sulfatase activity
MPNSIKAQLLFTSKLMKHKQCSARVIIYVVIVIASSLLLGCLSKNASRLSSGEPIPTPSFVPVLVATRQVSDDTLLVLLPQSDKYIEMTFVPPGNFLMGSTNEPPMHDVYLDAFWIDRTEVTNAQFSVFVEMTGYETLAEQKGKSLVRDAGIEEINGANWQHPEGPGSNIDNRLDYPVVHVTWDDAFAYCMWRGARLPTEAEWEKAARGTDGRLFPWGNQFEGTIVNFCDANCPENWKNAAFDDGYGRTSPVGSYETGISPYGILDLAGNVAEWIADWYADEYYAYSPVHNPLGPTEEDLNETNFTGHGVAKIKVIRGGSWADEDLLVAADIRKTNFPDYHNDALGFRCVTTP